jgi:4-hydroxy-4-methyl-2-oxoglutarate aldolase
LLLILETLERKKKMSGVTDVNQSLVDEFKKLDTTCVSDAMDRLGIRGGLLGIRPVNPGTVLCGQAFTVHYVPCGVVKGTVGDFLDDVKPGQVVVIDNNGRTNCTVWGDLMSITASRNHIAGTIIDGVCRDIPTVRKLNYPIFTKGVYMVTGKDRVEADGINVNVAVSDVVIKPGDIILGDDTGVVAVPLEKAKEVLAAAKEIDEKEELIKKELEKGITLREARNKVHYHNLQTYKK